MGEKPAFTKTDMERVGLFKEMSYVTVNDRYKNVQSNGFNESASKGRQLLPGGSKMKSALQAGYFDDKFGRIMDGESYSDPIKLRRQTRLKEAQKNLGKPFMPSSGEKKMCGLGNHYGTLGGPVSHFSAQNRLGQPYKAPAKNVQTNPHKKGTGYGYVQVTLGPYHKYMSDEYDRTRAQIKKENTQHRAAMKGAAFKLNMHPTEYFDGNPFKSDKPLPPVKAKPPKDKDVRPFKPSSPAKFPGGMKAGTFDPYPSHSADGYKDRHSRPKDVVNKSGKVFVPTPGPKTAPSNSILHQNVMQSINCQNYRTTTSIMSY